MQVPGQLRLHKETLTQKKKNPEDHSRLRLRLLPCQEVPAVVCVRYLVKSEVRQAGAPTVPQLARKAAGASAGSSAVLHRSCFWEALYVFLLALR